MTLHGGIRVLLGLCYTEPIKAHDRTYVEVKTHNFDSRNTQSFCLFVYFADLGIVEVSDTHPPASSCFCFQGVKRRRMEERRLNQ